MFRIARHHQPSSSSVGLGSIETLSTAAYILLSRSSSIRGGYSGPTRRPTNEKQLQKQRAASAAALEARAKRKRKIRPPKAIDRGLPNVTVYQPASLRAATGLPDRTRPFTVLGIETSCDDTGAAVVRSDGLILGEALAKQIDIHQPWGGIVPGLARDAHVLAMDRVVEEALSKAGLDSVRDVDAVAVTVGPGLEICLRVGCQKAVALAEQYQKPFVGVHHLEAHILMARMPFDNRQQQQ